MGNNRDAFTLVEFLIVIGIIAVIAVVIALILNPIELLRQSRDSQRISDMSALNAAASLYNIDVSGGYMGQPQTVYVSVPDSQATTTQGTNCASLGLPTLPLNWSYHCVAPLNLRNIDGTGWVPINFQKISFRAPFATLPIDPQNASSSGLYYTYQKGSWEFTAEMESMKYNTGSGKFVISNDGGKFNDLYEIGTNLTLLVVDRAAVSTATTSPLVSITSPSYGDTVSGTVVVSASASDTVGIAGVQFLLDGANLGSEVTIPPYQTNWDTTLTSNGSHGLTAYARDTASNATTSAVVAVTVNNATSSLPALVQFTVTSNAPASTCSAQLNSSVTAGDLLVLSVDTNSSTAVLSVSDNKGNTWNTANNNSSAAGTQSIFYAANATSGITNVTVTITNWSNAFRSCELAEYSGATSMDVKTSSTGTGSLLASGTSTTNFGNELIIGAGSTPSCSSCTPSAGPGFIIVAASSKSFQEYRTVTSAGGYSATASISTSTQWLMNMATFH
jgi:prepilin-type N-terminal cleavage/methylation domain-containing protein